MIELKRTIRRRRLLNLTPLIDIIFLLVVFFLLTSKFELSTGVVLSVKSGDEESVSAARSDLSGIYILDDYTIEYDKMRYSLREYLEFFDQSLSDNAVTDIKIFSSKNVSVQTVVTLMEELKLRNVSSVQLLKMRGS